MPAISPRENRIGRAILVFFLAVLCVPYLVAALLVPPGTVWGGLLWSADDQNVHLMWARQARDGAFFLRDLFTTESLVSGERPLFWNVLPWLMGVFSRFSGVDSAVWYHVFRVGLAGVALWQLHRLAVAVTRGEAKWENARLFALALGALSSGMGFMALVVPGILNHLILIDFPENRMAFPAMPEAFMLLSALFYPLNIASYALLAFIWTQILHEEKPFQAFMGALLLANIHTYNALPLVGAILVWLAVQKRISRVALAVGIGALIPVIYQIIVFRESSEFQIKALTPTPAPAIWHVLFAFAPLLVLALFSLRQRRELPLLGALWIWFLVTLVAIYAPVSFARKMLEGAQIPLLILAGVGFCSLRLASKNLLFAAFVLLMSLSPLYFLLWSHHNFAENNLSRVTRYLMPPLYLSAGEKGALEFLDAQPKNAVLCLPMLGSYVPRASGQTTYLGHWAETLYAFEKKLPHTMRYFSGRMNAEQARVFFRENRISFVIESAYERSLSRAASPSQNLGLQKVWSDRTGEVAVFATGF